MVVVLDMPALLIETGYLGLAWRRLALGKLSSVLVFFLRPSARNCGFSLADARTLTRGDSIGCLCCRDFLPRRCAPSLPGRTG